MAPLRAVLLPALLGWSLVLAAVEPVAAAQKREVVHLKRSHDKGEVAVRALALRLRKQAKGNIRVVERALAATGLPISRLIKKGEARGGPFVPAHGGAHHEVDRWESLSRAVRVLPLAAPLADYLVTSDFGDRLDPINSRRAMHEGIDLTAPLRTRVAATAPGKVVFAGVLGGYGRLVEIDHGFGVHTRYGHLAAINVRVGQNVAAGQRVGLLGSSGRSTGPHLHYEVRVDDTPRNPAGFLNAGKNLKISP